MLLMLEDDAERIERFAETLRLLDAELPLRIWRDAHAMIREAGPLLGCATLISLDHDLEPLPGAGDPGDGLDVARFLVSQPIVRPVIIHTSNRDRSTMMEGEFELARWPFRRVAPIGDDWIEAHWRYEVKRALRRSRRKR
jgi:Cyclic-phosphate processing Receiver domain